MPFLRLAHCQDEQALRHPSLHALQQPLPAEQERALLANLASCLQRRLNRCAHMRFQGSEVCLERGVRRGGTPASVPAAKYAQAHANRQLCMCCPLLRNPATPGL